MKEEIEVLDWEDEPSIVSYEDYIDAAKAITQQTTQDNSIIFNFKLEGDTCLNKITKFDIDGSHQVMKEHTFSNSSDFLPKLLEPILINYVKLNKIIINTVTPEKEELALLKVISETNDMFEVSGLNNKEATRLSELVEEIKRDQSKKNITTASPNYQQKIDERGFGNVVGLLISIAAIGTVILGMLFSNFLK